MFKKLFILLFILVSLFTFTGCDDKKEKKLTPDEPRNDAIRFKNEYESLNGKVFEYGDVKITTRSIEISRENPFVYKTPEEIVELMDNDETFVVYFGFNSCPWCRSVIEILEDVALDNGIDTVYYVDVKEIRDIKELDDDNNVVTKKEGTKGYYRLLEYFDKVLDDYILKSESNEEFSADEKRIYAPNVVAVVNGEPKKMVTGISEKQTESNMDLTDEIKKDTYQQFESIIELVEQENIICNKDSKC